MQPAAVVAVVGLVVAGDGEVSSTRTEHDDKFLPAEARKEMNDRASYVPKVCCNILRLQTEKRHMFKVSLRNLLCFCIVMVAFR